MEDYDEVFKFCENREYPSDLSKDQKRNFRRRCTESFMVKDGLLYYRKYSRGKPSGQQNDWKLCVKNADEKERIMISCHSSATGMIICCSMHAHGHPHNYNYNFSDFCIHTTRHTCRGTPW